MTAARTVPDEPSFTTDQLTRDDLTALSAFVDARIAELADRGENGAASVLREALGYHLEVLRLSFQWEDDYGTPPPPRELAERERAWNVLVCAVWTGWHDVDGYDARRWALVHTPREAHASAEEVR